MKDEFITVADPSEGFYMEKGSKFLAFVFPAKTEKEFDEYWHSLKKAHPKARHFCWALRLNDTNETQRSNDDGEPSGTAGRPILNQLIKKDLWNTGLIVVRYFGGTKLGVPGLIEAYRSSAEDAIQKTSFMTGSVYSQICFVMEYDQHPSFINFCKKKNVPIMEETFSEKASVTIGFKASGSKEDVISFMKDYSQLDLPSLEDYLTVKKMRIEYIPGYTVQ